MRERWLDPFFFFLTTTQKQNAHRASGRAIYSQVNVTIRE